MKILKWIRDEATNEIQYITECGVFTKEMTFRGYSSHVYNLRKVSGEWPSKRDIALFCDHRYDVFGAEVSVDGDSAYVKCYVD